MGKLLIKTPAQTQVVSLKEHVLIGRYPNCDIIISTVAKPPNLWLEIRFVQGEWLWTTLHGASDTIATGEFVQRQWRRFTKKIRFADPVSIELFDTSPPEVLVEQANKVFRPVSDFPDIKLCQETYMFDGQVLVNGQPFLYHNHIATLWAPGSNHTTEKHTISTRLEECILRIDTSTLSAEFQFENKSYTLSGEIVRILSIYAQALDSDEPWLTRKEVYAEWLALGGSTESPTERMHWGRNKIKQRLETQGFLGKTELFQRKRHKDSWRHKLCFPRTIQLTS